MTQTSSPRTSPRTPVLAVLVALVMVLSLITASAAPRITEDDPRWNCATMGNGICGSQAAR